MTSKTQLLQVAGQTEFESFAFLVDYSKFDSSSLSIGDDGKVSEPLGVRLPPYTRDLPVLESIVRFRMDWIEAATKLAIHNHFFPSGEPVEISYRELHTTAQPLGADLMQAFERFGLAFYRRRKD